MSPAFAKGNGRILTIYVTTGFVQRSTGRTNKSLARDECNGTVAPRRTTVDAA
jgi:hypothetical protein